MLRFKTVKTAIEWKNKQKSYLRCSYWSNLCIDSCTNWLSYPLFVTKSNIQKNKDKAKHKWAPIKMNFICLEEWKLNKLFILILFLLCMCVCVFAYFVNLWYCMAGNSICKEIPYKNYSRFHSPKGWHLL